MLTYAKCAAMLEVRSQKKLAGNTYLRKEGSQFIVKYHDTDIVKFIDDSKVELNTSGYLTPTTKNRLNDFSPARISQKGGIWYVYSNGTKVAYHDGMIVDSDGAPIHYIDMTSELEEKKRILDSEVRDYIKGFVAYFLDNGFQQPSPGDCWDCLFTSGTSLEHVWSHVKERYYFGAFLRTCVKETGRTQFYIQLIEADVNRGSGEMLRELLTAYFRKVKSGLMHFVETGYSQN